MKKVLLISVKPEFASKIFNGEKRIELRKIKPNIKKGDIVVIYESSPTMALKGSFIVNEVVSGCPDTLWNTYSAIAGISRQKYELYYQNHEKAYGIVFNEISEYKVPLSLELLRKLWDGFAPPQSYRYLSYEDSEKLAWL